MTKLGIVGYRGYTDYDQFCKYIKHWKTKNNIKKIKLIISGGCMGTDTLAERYAKEHKIKMRVFKPDWNKYGNAAGPIRNKLIVKDSEYVIAFLHELSKGTLSSIKYAKELDKHLTIIKIS